MASKLAEVHTRQPPLSAQSFPRRIPHVWPLVSDPWLALFLQILACVLHVCSSPKAGDEYDWAH